MTTSSKPDRDEDGGVSGTGGSGGAPTQSIDFATFVMSLAASALIHLGEHEDDHGQIKVNLPLARQSIEILGLLRDKTRGNLTPEEQSTLEHVLYDLRLRFLKLQRP